MEFPHVTPWYENKLSVVEKMKVLKPFRDNKNGEIIKMKKGDPIDLKGDLKKDLYHQLKVCYPADFDALDKFFEAQKQSGVTYAAPPSVAKATDVDILKGKVAELVIVVEAQNKTIAELIEQNTAPGKGGKKN